MDKCYNDMVEFCWGKDSSLVLLFMSRYVDGSVNWHNHYRNWCKGFQKLKKIELSWYSAIPSWFSYILHQRYLNTHVYGFSVHYRKKIESVICSLTDGWLKNVVYTHNEVLFDHKEMQNHKICQKVVGPGEYSMKLTNPSSERQILHVLPHMWILHFKLYICTFMWNIVWVEARKLGGVHERGRRRLKGWEQRRWFGTCDMKVGN